MMDSRTDARLYRIASAAHHLHASCQLGRPRVLIRFAQWRLNRAARAAVLRDLNMPPDEWWSAIQRRYTLLASMATLRSPNPWRDAQPPARWCDLASFQAMTTSLNDKPLWTAHLAASTPLETQLDPTKGDQ